MFPDHCKKVSLKRVDFQLNAKTILENLKGKRAYKRTIFYTLNNEDEWAVVKIRKDIETDLFGTITDLEVISLPNTTCYFEDPELDVLNPTMMAEKAEELGCETLIVKGKFEHVSFIHKEERYPILVYEVVPPGPAKLVELVDSVIHSGNVKRPIKIVPKILDITELVKQSEKDIIIFPCKASQLKVNRRTKYLDDIPEISQDDLKDVVLVGCDLSLKIFKEHYDFEPEFHNFCPQKWAEREGSQMIGLTKCCQVKEGHIISHNLAIVPWGANPREVEDAINHLLDR